MKKFIGTKLINAKVMNRLDQNVFRGWNLPTDENGDDEGYLVEYIAGGKANTKEFKGYVSWSPKDVFEKAYKPSGGLSFGQAIEAMKKGKKVCRSGWNGKGMFVYLVNGTSVMAENLRNEAKKHITPLYEITEMACRVVEIGSHIDMKAADGSIVVGWLASQTDILAEDWEIL